MPISLREYLAQAPQRDAEAKRIRATAEATEDDRYDALGNLIEAHPIGRLISHGGCHALDEEDDFTTYGAVEDGLIFNAKSR